MRHEAIDRGVRQDQHLRCPPPDDHAKAGDACLELVQEPCTLAEYFFFSFTLYSFLHLYSMKLVAHRFLLKEIRNCFFLPGDQNVGNFEILLAEII